MRSSIVAWSALSGVVMGMLVDALLVGIALALSVVFPGLAARVGHRWAWAAAMLVLIAVPLALAAVGYLEGTLKAS